MRDYKEEAQRIVSAMTLEEKVSQMLYTASGIERLGIPSYNWWNEALHGVARSGVATVFPQAIGLAASFDPKLVERVAEVISTEARGKYHAYQEEGDHGIYKGLTFWSPNINIFRDPRWGRGHETYGEDPYLTARLGVAFIKGLQGDDPDVLKTAACAKHFAVHSGPEGERHAFNAEVSGYDLWNTYLPAFEAAVKEAGVEAVMGAYNRTNGEPCCGSKVLLHDILREKWGFDGHVTSDCWAIKDFHEFHKVTDTAAESAALAVKNGCDVNCGVTYGYCLEAVRGGLLTEEDIDRSVLRLMTTRLRLGILGEEKKNVYASIPYEAVDCDEHRAFNLDTARKSLVLLKNNGVLPLALRQVKTIGVIGPNADSRAALEGNYQGTASEYRTVLGGMKALASEKGIRIMYAEGCHLFKDRMTNLAAADDRLAEALTVARRADAVVLCAGLDANLEGEEGDAGNAFASGDKTSLQLPGRQLAMMEKVAEAAGDKPVIVVVLSGSALDLSWADKHADAVVQAFYPGAQGGLAAAELLLGEFSPQGKLPLTFYRSDGDLPDFRDYSMENRTYRYFKGEALYPFGYGLSYDRFTLESAVYENGHVKVTVLNEGSRGGIPQTDAAYTRDVSIETVEVYASAEGTKERWNLCGLAKIGLKRGERTEAEITVSPAVFQRYDNNGDLQTCAGKKRLYVGFCQPDARSTALVGQNPLVIDINL